LYEGLRVEPQARDLPSGEIEIDHLVFRADHLHLADARHAEDFGADSLHIIAQLALRQAVGREAVDIAVNVAKLVVEARRLHTGGQRILNILHMFADLIE
jgi:hypothetical protein